MSERSELAGAPRAVEAELARRGGGRLFGRLRRKTKGSAFDLDLHVDPLEPHVGDSITVRLAPGVDPPPGLEVGLVGQVTYWELQEDPDGPDTAVRTSAGLHADWRLLPEGLSEVVEHFVLPNAPYSYTGEKVAFWWQIATRSQWKLATGVDTFAAGVLKQEENLRPGPAAHLWVRP